MNRAKRVVLRDLLIFQIKLMMDGMKDIVLAPVAVLAVVTDMMLPGDRFGHRFYAVIVAGERFDRWLNLFGAAGHASADRDGLFGASRAGSDSMLGRLEAVVLGHDEPGEERHTTAA